MTRAVRLALAVAVSTLAGANEDAAPNPEEARRHFRLGVDLYKEGKFAEALVEFERAHELKPHPLVLYNIAVTHRELSHYDDAIRALEEFLSVPPEAAGADLREKAQGELRDLHKRVATVSIATRPEGVTVRVGRRDLGTTPFERPFALAPGTYRFEFFAPDGQRKEQKLTLASGDQGTLDIEFNAASASDPEATPAAAHVSVQRAAEPLGGVVGLSAAAASNLVAVGETGAPIVGVSTAWGRMTFGIDAVLVAYAVVPNLRVRIIGRKVALYGLVAVPISITDGDESDLFVAGAGGLGLRYWIHSSFALRAEAMLSVAGGGHGVTVPGSIGAEFWL